MQHKCNFCIIYNYYVIHSGRGVERQNLQHLWIGNITITSCLSKLGQMQSSLFFASCWGGIWPLRGKRDKASLQGNDGAGLVPWAKNWPFRGMHCVSLVSPGSFSDCIVPVHRDFLAWPRLSQLLCICSWENMGLFGFAVFYTQVVGNEEKASGLTSLATSLHYGSSFPPMSSWLWHWALRVKHLLGFMTNSWKNPSHHFCEQLYGLL